MDLYFDKGYTFVLNDEQWVIVGIDWDDYEYPYECYPVEVVNEAKQIIENGGIIDDNPDFVYDDYRYLLEDVYVDNRQCLSEYFLFEIMHEAMQKENEELKAEIITLKGGN